MKEISSNQLNIRNDITYEINSRSPFTGFGVQHYNSGELRSKTSYKNGKLDGEICVYYPNGNLKSKGTHKNGKLDGLVVNNDTNGKLLSTYITKNDKLNGPTKFYDVNGTLESIITSP